MLKRANRLTSALFKSLESAQGEHTKNFFFKYSPNTQSYKDKFAIVISKKVSGSAVIRNKLKRRISAVLEDKNLSESKSKPLLIVIYAKRGAQNLTTREIKEELRYSQVFHSL